MLNGSVRAGLVIVFVRTKCGNVDSAKQLIVQEMLHFVHEDTYRRPADMSRIHHRYILRNRTVCAGQLILLIMSIAPFCARIRLSKACLYELQCRQIVHSVLEFSELQALL